MIPWPVGLFYKVTTRATTFGGSTRSGNEQTRVQRSMMLVGYFRVHRRWRLATDDLEAPEDRRERTTIGFASASASLNHTECGERRVAHASGRDTTRRERQIAIAQRPTVAVDLGEDCQPFRLGLQLVPELRVSFLTLPASPFLSTSVSSAVAERRRLFD